MIIYISGPVTGIRNNNRRNFEKARKKLEDAFFDSRIISPLQIALMAELDQKHTKPQWADYMRACIKALMDATHVYFIKGWEKSRGAILERQIAEGLDIPCAESIEDLKTIISGGKHGN
jgi:hypothetical protein